MFSNITSEYKELGLSPGFKISIIIVLGLEIIFGICASCTVLLIYWNKRSVRSVATKFIANLALIDLIICCVCVPFTIARVSGFAYHSALFCCWHEAVTSALRNASFITLLLICYDRYKSVTNPFVLRLTHLKARRAVILVWCLSTVSVIAPFLEWRWKAKTLWSSACILMFSESKEPCFFSPVLSAIVFIVMYDSASRLLANIEGRLLQSAHTSHDDSNVVHCACDVYAKAK